MSTKKSVPQPIIKDLVITRVLNAPRKVVWKAWTDPKHLAQWWGPKGFTNPRCEVDVRAGGLIHIDMRAPDGTIYPMPGAYRKIVEPKKIVFTSGAAGPDGKLLFEFLNTVTFTEKKGRTTLKLTTHLLNSTPGAMRYISGQGAGWSSSLQKLAEFVEDTSDREIVIARTFDAPRERVWEAWTNPKHIVQWWGPKGFTTTIEQMDVRPGGMWKQVMHGPDGTDYPSQSMFREVAKPERIVFSHAGGRKGAQGVNLVMIWTFEVVGKKTKVTIRQIYPTAADRDRTVKEYNAVKGGKQTLGRLAEFLKRGAKGLRNKGTKGKAK
jgi:uncharacterized protein YndB with AHSA1/START domain